jgi:hypothetical protein
MSKAWKAMVLFCLLSNMAFYLVMVGALAYAVDYAAAELSLVSAVAHDQQMLRREVTELRGCHQDSH